MLVEAFYSNPFSVSTGCCVCVLGVDGRALDSFHLLEYCVVPLVILASTVLTLRLVRKGTKSRKSRRRDIGPPLTQRQMAGAIAIMVIWWIGLISMTIYIDSTVKPWTFEEWVRENLHTLFLAVLCLVIILGSVKTLAKRNAFPSPARASSSAIPTTGWGMVRAALVVTIPVAIALYLVRSIEVALGLVAFGVVLVLVWWVMSSLEGRKD